MDRSSPQCSSPDCSFNDASINCKGSCRQRFHAVCVGLPADSVPMIAASSSFYWFWDVCRDHIRTGRTTVAVRSVEVSSGEEKSCGSTSCIFTDQLVACDGLCGKDFHGMCVKLSKSDLAVIGSSSNIVWFCAECKLNVIPVVGEPEHRDVEDREDPSDSLPNSKGISGADPVDNVEDHETDRGKPGCSTNSEGCSNDDDSSMKYLESSESGELRDSEADVTSSACSLGISNVSVPDDVKSHTKVFTFSAKSESASPLGIANLSPVATKKPEKDENNNSPAPRKRPLDIDSTIVAIVPKTVKKNSSVFSLYLRFIEPNMSTQSAENAVRHALGMSHSDRVTAWNVVPHHILFPTCSTFRVDFDARWKSAALECSTWRFTANYKEHREWFTVKIA